MKITEIFLLRLKKTYNRRAFRVWLKHWLEKLNKFNLDIQRLLNVLKSKLQSSNYLEVV